MKTEKKRSLMKSTVAGIVCLIGLVFVPPVVAIPPDSGTLLQEQRQPRGRLPDRLPSEQEEELTPPPAGPEIQVRIRGFRFTGYEGIAAEAELQEVLKPYIGKDAGFAELQKMAAALTNYLRQEKGYLLARAYLPKQDVTDGIIHFVIVSGRIDGKVDIRLQEPARIRPSLLEGIAARAVPGDGIARMEQIERAVLLMNDLPGIEAGASLEPGSRPGTTRVVVHAAEGPLLHGVFAGDNYGDPYTGAYRGTGQVSAYDPSGLGDQADVSYTGAERLHTWRAGYALPVGSTGFTWNASYTGLIYRLGKELENLDAKGRADTIATGIGYPLMRTRAKSLWANLGFEYLLLEDEAQGAKIRDRKVAVGAASLTGNFFDHFGGGGLTDFSVALNGGDVDLSSHEANRLFDGEGPRTEGGFVRGTYFLGRLQRLTRQTTLFGSIRGQFASGNLDSSQKFILGGPAGVRAYPVGEAPADDGHAATVEARYDVPFLPAWAAAQLIGFFDTGWVRLHHSPWAGSVTNLEARNDYILSGAGAGVIIGKPGAYSLRASYAHRIGINEGRSAADKDSDGRSDDGRFWLQLLIWM